MVGNLVVAWGVVGRTCRDVVARREGEVLLGWEKCGGAGIGGGCCFGGGVGGWWWGW